MRRILIPVLLGALLSLVFPAVSFFLMDFTPAEILALKDTEKNVSGSLNIKAVGDIMLGRSVGVAIGRQGLSYPFDKTREFLNQADLTFANLEGALSDQGLPVPGKGIWLRAAPASVESLQMAGIDIVSLANNHAMDYGERALQQTMALLNSSKIAYIGAGDDQQTASQVHYQEVNGIKTAWLAYTEFTRNTGAATEDTPGVAPFIEENILKDIESAKKSADIVILSLHWGSEYQDLPHEYQRAAAHSFIDGGADIIIGHHPHYIQGVETYKNGLIAYSLGNFVFDQNQAKTKQGLILSLEISKFGWQKAELYPVEIVDYQPRILSGEAASEIFEHLKTLSQGFEGEFQALDGYLSVSAP